MRCVLVMAVVALTAACGSRSGTPTAPSTVTPTVPIMGSARLSAPQIVAWVNGRQPVPPGSYAATVPLDTLATYFIEEGAVEGVTGDVAFMQSVVETGWFRFGGVVQASANNFAGLGATDSNGVPATFPDARTGVRAQIQHLRAYADPSALTCSVPPLHRPCVDPRFNLVTPKGKAPTWNQLGNGNWATAPTYAGSILALYEEARAFSSISVAYGFSRTPLFSIHRLHRRHSGAYSRSRMRSSTLRLSVKTTNTSRRPINA